MADTRMHEHWAMLLLRLFVGVLFLTAGLGKFSNLAGFHDFIMKDFSGTILPGPLLDVFGRGLPFVEVTVGALSVLGLWTRVGLGLGGLTMLSLFFGKLLTHDLAVSAYNALYFLIIVLALRASDANRFSVDALLSRRGA